MTTNYTIVVARYTEDIGYLNDVDNVVIYNKGTPLEQKNVINRPNIGRESETYLYHIINNYNNLPDYLILIQGSPFYHMNGINPNNFSTELLKLINKRVVSIEPLFTNLHTENHCFYPSIKTREYYSFLINPTSIPDKMQFAAGCQYIIPKECILKNGIDFYKKIHNMLLNNKIIDDKTACY
jgi:hypothetical protein